jgi:hypothetical protein
MDGQRMPSGFGSPRAASTSVRDNPHDLAVALANLGPIEGC